MWKPPLVSIRDDTYHLTSTIMEQDDLYVRVAQTVRVTWLHCVCVCCGVGIGLELN